MTMKSNFFQQLTILSYLTVIYVVVTTIQCTDAAVYQGENGDQRRHNRRILGSNGSDNPHFLLHEEQQQQPITEFHSISTPSNNNKMNGAVFYRKLEGCQDVADEVACDGLIGEGCFWCDSLSSCLPQGECNGNGGPPGGGPPCRNKENESDCSLNSCWWCTDDMGGGVCKDTEADCRGNGGGPPCQSKRNEADCVENMCSWCARDNGEGGVCKQTEEGCQGGPPDGGPPCRSKQNQTDCSANMCSWCSDDTGGGVCKETDDDCSSGGNNGGGEVCNRLQTQTLCSSFTNDSGDLCFWCQRDDEEREAGVCRNTELDCPADNGHGGGNNVCNSKQNETECVNTLFPDQGNTDASCVWCSGNSDSVNGDDTNREGERGACRKFETDCPGNGGHVCNRIQDEMECNNTDPGDNSDESSCFWCPNEGKCRTTQSDCPGGGGGGGPESGGGGVCNRVQNATECTETQFQIDDSDILSSCHWCSEQEKCRKTESDCRGGGGGNGKVCSGIRNETKCGDREECFWCDQGLCRNSQQECPGRGRGNPCARLQDDDCSSKAECLWCEDLGQQGLCTSNRGNRECPANRTVLPCPEIDDGTDCQANIRCRWCDNDSTCMNAQATCNDGSAGIRGNPCQGADSEESCPNGCLWCASKSECLKPSDRFMCFDNDGGNTSVGNPCRFVDTEPECGAECRWCSAQSRCKLSQASCEEPIGEAAVELKDTGAQFMIQDDGLGSTDPNAVSFTLDHIVEIAEDGLEIGPSFLHLASSTDFEIKQSIGDFFGVFDDVTSRRIQFEGIIAGVGKIEIETFIMLESGTINTRDGQALPVQKGDVKFNMEMKEWTFCDPTNSPCGDSDMTSAFVDVAVRIQGSNDAPEPSGTDDLLFNLGSVPFQLSGLVEVDEFVQDMPEGFPRAESTENGGTLFYFRFPRFDSSVFYDPVIEFHQSLIVVTEPPTPAPTSEILVPATSEPSGAENTTSAPAPSPEEKKSDDDDGGSSVGAIVGGVVGGAVGLCCCCALVGYFMSKRGEEKENLADANDFFGVENKDTNPGSFEDEERGNIFAGGIKEEEDESDEGNEEDESDEDYDDEDSDDSDE